MKRPDETRPKGGYRFTHPKMVDWLHPDPNDPLHRTSDQLYAALVYKLEVEELDRMLGDE